MSSLADIRGQLAAIIDSGVPEDPYAWQAQVAWTGGAGKGGSAGMTLAMRMMNQEPSSLSTG